MLTSFNTTLHTDPSLWSSRCPDSFRNFFYLNVLLLKLMSSTWFIESIPSYFGICLLIHASSCLWSLIGQNSVLAPMPSSTPLYPLSICNTLMYLLWSHCLALHLTLAHYVQSGATPPFCLVFPDRLCLSSWLRLNAVITYKNWLLTLVAFIFICEWYLSGKTPQEI